MLKTPAMKSLMKNKLTNIINKIKPKGGETMSENNVVKSEDTIMNIQKYIEEEPSIRPLIDLFESKEDFFMKVYLPGVKKENLIIKLDENLLTIFGKVDFKALEDKRYLIRERGVANYYRVFELSEKIDSSKIEAKLEDGILYLTLPKTEKAKPKEIVIN